MKFIIVLVNLLLACTALSANAYAFPKGFRWCVSTAAHQIEGQNQHSDWWEWEQHPNHIRNGEKSGLACDSWNRYREDISAIRYLNATDYRFSIEWARLEPQEGKWDESAIVRYKEIVDDLKKNGIRPVLTLHHFTFPKWVSDRGGWEWEGIAPAFSKFTELVYTRIAPEVSDWVTVNEPLVNIFAGYVEGIFPPGQKRPFAGILPVLRGLLKSHAASYRVLHSLAKDHNSIVKVGMAHHLRAFKPAQWWNPLDQLLAYLIDKTWNWALPDALETGKLRFVLYGLLHANEEIPGLASTQDFLGINYYTTDQLHFSFTKGMQRLTREDLPKNDLGWDIDADGFYETLIQAKDRYPGKTILITENGIADSSDKKRETFLVEYLEKLAAAIDAGAPIEGYCHWSLLDNFEWAEGFTPKFGLFETDYKTLKRIPRSSAILFQRIAKENGFTN